MYKWNLRLHDTGFTPLQHSKMNLAVTLLRGVKAWVHLWSYKHYYYMFPFEHTCIR